MPVISERERRERLQRQLNGWATMLSSPSAASPSAPARQADQERRQREDDRARLARLKSQWHAFRQATARAAQQQRQAAFWQERARGLDELIAMTQPPQPAVQPAQSGEPYDGTPLLGHSDFNVALTQEALSWW